MGFNPSLQDVSGSLSSPFEPPADKDLTSSFVPNSYNFQKESREVLPSRSFVSDLYIFAGIGSGYNNESKVSPGKKRKITSEHMVSEFIDTDLSNAFEFSSSLNLRVSPSTSEVSNTHNYTLSSDLIRIEDPECFLGDENSGTSLFAHPTES
ncbi:hypothetical protein LOD99_6199 [Oopsacas minuta]|uniref:Uncharacterized protein n=1 Tax=Oopsacas minuta TaxID=111878 RepID=A0AAV7JMD1_9METZ|nr:hypothetical protein LOD99_6199 [Oopsacas minuta]